MSDESARLARATGEALGIIAARVLRIADLEQRVEQLEAEVKRLRGLPGDDDTKESDRV